MTITTTFPFAVEMVVYVTIASTPASPVPTAPFYAPDLLRDAIASPLGVEARAGVLAVELDSSNLYR